MHLINQLLSFSFVQSWSVSNHDTHDAASYLPPKKHRRMLKQNCSNTSCSVEALPIDKTHTNGLDTRTDHPPSALKPGSCLASIALMPMLFCIPFLAYSPPTQLLFYLQSFTDRHCTLLFYLHQHTHLIQYESQTLTPVL